jgi:hypothetical protein
MIEPGNSLGNCCNRRTIGHGRSFEHEYRHSECSRGRNLAVSRLATAVLCNDRVDGKRLEQLPVVRLGEGPALEEVMGVRNIQGRIDGIHTANEIVMLWSGAEWRQLLPTDREENPSRALTQRANGTFRISNIDPLIAIYLGPRWPAHSENWRAGSRCRDRGIRGNRCGIGMSRIDQKIDALCPQIFNEPIGAPEPATTHGNVLGSRRSGSAGKGDSRGERAIRERSRKLASLSSSPQD